MLALGPVHADLEQSLANGDWAEAERHLEELSAAWAEAAETPDDQLEWARTLLVLGTVERKQAKAAEATAHLREALGRFEAHAPGEAGGVREALALALQDQGELQEAEPLLRMNLEAGYPTSRDHLAVLVLQRGGYEEAGRLLQEALDDTPEDQRLDRARRLGRMGGYWHTMGSHARALDHFDEASGLLPDDAPLGLRLSLISGKALAHLRLGESTAAGEQFDLAADLALEGFADTPLDTIPHILNLGNFAMATGDPGLACRFYREALDTATAVVGAEHPSLITAHNNLGTALQQSGNYDESRIHLELAASMQSQYMPGEHLRVAETARNLAATALLGGHDDARQLTAEANLAGLGLLDRLLRHGTETERLNFLQRIDLLSLSCTLGDAGVVADLLLASKARLLDQMIRPSEAVDPPTWMELRESLPEDAAMIDFCRYTPPNGEARYGAVVLSPALTSPAWVPLGTEARIGGWIESMHDRLAWKAAALSGGDAPPPPFKLTGILRQLHRECLEPLEAVIPDHCKQLVFVPDGILHGIPFAALRQEDGRFLCEVHELGVVATSGRDLMVDRPARDLQDHPWLLAGVSEFPSTVRRVDSPLDGVLRNPAPLPGSRDELHRLARLAPPGSRTVIECRENDLRRQTRSPRVWHMSSHSFFLDAPETPGAPFDFDRSADRLFASGILLHRAAEGEGAALRTSPDDDLLFPSEIAALPLSETRLTTLSSCLSGAGTAVGGEGLLGLQRALVMAGCREVVSALWPVPDDSSPEFMDHFYQGALATGHPAQALWHTQRRLIQGGSDVEASLLAGAGFTLTQRGGLLPLAEIPERGQSFPWKWLLVPVPFFAFLAARALRRGKP